MGTSAAGQDQTDKEADAHARGVAGLK